MTLLAVALLLAVPGSSRRRSCRSRCSRASGARRPELVEEHLAALAAIDVPRQP